MKLKELRAEKARLDAAVRAKLDEIKTDMPQEDVEKIEREAEVLLKQTDDLAVKIATREAELDKIETAPPAAAAATAASEAGTVLSRAATIEVATAVSQFRDLGVDLDLVDVLSRNLTADAVRKMAFEKLSEKSKSKGPEGTTVEITRDEREGVAESMELALTRRLLESRGRQGFEFKGLKGSKAQAEFTKYEEQSRQYMGLGLVEMAAQCIGYRGRGNFLTTNDALVIFERAFQSTSDFPNIFQNALNKSLLARYQLVTPTYREIAAERPFKDFRPHPQVRAGDFPTLQPVTETGELKYGSSSDNNESVSVAPYGVIFTISRQMLVNDDLGGIDQILSSSSDAVLIFENNTFFTMFNANPTLLQDSTAVFASGHNNLAGSGTVPSVTSIGLARQSLRTMKSISGNFINVPPAIILSGPIQETTIDQMVASISPTLTTSVNPFSGRLHAVADANITDTSWYICADPGRVPCFIYGFLNGSAGPRTRSEEPFGVQGVRISLEHDFGVGAIDYRGFYKNPGA